jgi:Sulfotransferase domain
MMKSASEFIRENLICALDAPEIEISIGTVPRDRITPSAVQQIAKGGAVSRSHTSADNLAELIANGVERLVLHVRDPRQVTVAWVHHVRRYSDAEFRNFSQRYNPPVPAEIRQWDFSRQIDWAVDNYMPGQLQWLEDWVAALDKSPPITVMVSTFEEFLQSPSALFCRISDFFGVPEIQVPNLDEQSPAAMRNFRLGRVDEWRDVLTPRQMDSCKTRVEPLARRFGWSC